MRQQTLHNDVKDFHCNHNNHKKDVAKLVVEKKILPSEGYWFAQDVTLVSCLSFLRKRIEVAVWHKGPLNYLISRVGKPLH